jgi:hypothetical protein
MINLGGQFECISSSLLKRVWKEEDKSNRRSSRISKQAI